MILRETDRDRERFQSEVLADNTAGCLLIEIYWQRGQNTTEPCRKSSPE